MNWLKKLFAGKQEQSASVGSAAVTPAKILRPATDMSRPEAKRIGTESVREWCEKLDREAERTGNQRLRAQAANIRARLT